MNKGCRWYCGWTVNEQQISINLKTKKTKLKKTIQVIIVHLTPNKLLKRPDQDHSKFLSY